MANHKSALKRARQNEKRRLRNKSKKSRIKGVVKDFEEAISSKDIDKAKANLINAQKVIDRISSKGTIHKKTASRKISRLTKKLNAVLGASA